MRDEFAFFFVPLLVVEDYFARNMPELCFFCFIFQMTCLTICFCCICMNIFFTGEAKWDGCKRN